MDEPRAVFRRVPSGDATCTVRVCCAVQQPPQSAALVLQPTLLTLAQNGWLALGDPTAGEPSTGRAEETGIDC
jgi:hypothetical protein